MTTEDILRLYPKLSKEEAAEIAATVNKYLKQIMVVKAAEFACSPEGKKRGSGAMRWLNQSVDALNREEEGGDASDYTTNL